MSLLNRKAFDRILWLTIVRHRQINTIHKRASMLSGMIQETDKRSILDFNYVV